MTPWSALVVDDEALARSNLQLAFAEHPRWCCIAACASAAEARVALARQAVDLVVLDIRMPRENGLSYALELTRSASPPAVVFATAYDEHALAAFEVFALDYLLKPFDDARFAAMLLRVEQVLRWQTGAEQAASLEAYVHERAVVAAGGRPEPLRELAVRSVGRVERVQVAEILWLAAAGNYVELHLGGRALLHRSTLAALEERLPPLEFRRVHRTALVRVAQAASLQSLGDGAHQLTLRCGAVVPVSERHLAAVRALFGH
jgi:two-component system, LytTR family, response regulator